MLLNFTKNVSQKKWGDVIRYDRIIHAISYKIYLNRDIFSTIIYAATETYECLGIFF